MAIIQQQEQILLVLLACPVCKKYFQKGAFQQATNCVTQHEIGECCHTSDRELTVEFVQSVLQTVQHPPKPPKKEKKKKKK